jgi:hypothetical protein
MASEDTPRDSEEAKLERWLLGRFLDLGFPASMADDLVVAKVDWRDAERVLASNPPGGHAWVYLYLMPEVINPDA